MKPGRGAQLTSSPSFFTGQRAPTWLPVAGRDKDRCLSRMAPGNMECATCGRFLGTCTHSQVREVTLKHGTISIFTAVLGLPGETPINQRLQAAEMCSLPVLEPEGQEEVSAGRATPGGSRGGSLFQLLGAQCPWAVAACPQPLPGSVGLLSVCLCVPVSEVLSSLYADTRHQA